MGLFTLRMQIILDSWLTISLISLFSLPRNCRLTSICNYATSYINTYAFYLGSCCYVTIHVDVFLLSPQELSFFKYLWPLTSNIHFYPQKLSLYNHSIISVFSPQELSTYKYIYYLANLANISLFFLQDLSTQAVATSSCLWNCKLHRLSWRQ